MDTFDFQLPDDPPPEMVAIAQLGTAVSQLAAALDALHQQHRQLRETVERSRPGPAGPAGGADGPGMPWPLRWRDLDRDTAAQTWAWLIDWVGWFTDRYQLAAEIPACWHQHPPLVEELTALAAAWHACYDDTAYPDGPLLWHERLTRARDRIRDWDDHTRCRNGTHTARACDLAWPDRWHADAIDTANTDLADRPQLAAAEPEREPS